jgi:hypothetical protein
MTPLDIGRLRDTVDEALSDVLRSIDVALLANDREDARAVALVLNRGKGRYIEAMSAAITLVDATKGIDAALMGEVKRGGEP